MKKWLDAITDKYKEVSKGYIKTDDYLVKCKYLSQKKAIESILAKNWTPAGVADICGTIEAEARQELEKERGNE